jgi:4-amino-4-deoxychorismate mutase
MNTEDGLTPLRKELDRIDEELLGVVKARIDCCTRIAVHKRQNGIAMMQPHRIDAVQEHAARFAAEHGLEARFLRDLYDLLIAETCRVEDGVIADG